MAHIFQISTSQGGVPKRGVHEAEVDLNGITIDDQADKKHHGGPLQNLCLLRMETILELQREGHPIFPGSVGENITTIGLDASEMVPGVQLVLGESVRIELTDYATPCKTIAASFHDRNSNRINSKKYAEASRIYARVITGGTIRTGDTIRLLTQENPDEL